MKPLHHSRCGERGSPRGSQLRHKSISRKIRESIEGEISLKEFSKCSERMRARRRSGFPPNDTTPVM
jgi:hypothetical protein